MTNLKIASNAHLNPYAGNIENYIGFARIPTGLIDSLIVHHRDTSSIIPIPLTTTEGALVASYNRGAKAINAAGGVHALCIDEGIQRVPLFMLENVQSAVHLSEWLEDQKVNFDKLIPEVSAHAQLKSIDPIVEGNCVNLELTYTTGDAAGQNMITFCTRKIGTYIIEHAPVPIREWYIEGNMAGDKKSSAQYLKKVRGKRVVADITLPKEVVREILKTTPERLAEYWKRSIVNQVMSHSLGAHGHLANGLTALFLATGQDVACVSESALGISRFEVTENGDLYACITMSSLIVGTVGGGTTLPYAQTNLKTMGCQGKGKAIHFAEIATGLLLAGELSVGAAICEKQFADAHERLGRA